MREEDLLRFVWIADPRISPDGTRIAFTRVHVDEAADEYRTSLWLADADGGAAPRPLTFGDFDSEPRWSPDGRTLAFVRKPEREKPGQLHLLPLGGGEARAITKLEKGVSQPAWSPDGTRIAFLSGTNPALDDPAKPKPKNEPGRLVTQPVFRANGEGFLDFDHLDHVWVMDAAGDEPRAVTCGAFPEASPQWSRDGRWIFFLSDRRAEPWFGDEDCKLYAVSPDLGQPTDGASMKRVADVTGPLSAFTEAEDGSIAAVGSARTAPMRSYVRNDVLRFGPGEWPREGPVNLSAHHDFDAGESISSDQHPPRGGGAMPFAFEPGGRSVLAVTGRHGAARLTRYSTEPAPVEELTPADLEVICGSVSADARRVAMTMGSVGRPGDLHVYDVPSQRLSKVWGANDAWIDSAALGEVEEIWYPSFDGRRIQGWIVKPPGFDPKKKYPLILEIHGGPHTAYGVGFFHEFRVLAAAGYVVLYTNPRGSTTYGQEFGNIIQYRYPGDDVQDLLLGVEAVVSRGYIDEKRMGVTGGSGGGLLTNWIIAHDHRFAAAITQRCVADWISMYYSSDFALFTPFWFRKPPFEDPMEYLERSPAHFAARIETPLLVIHSEDDWRTPIGQGEIMFRALKQLRKPVAMVRFPGESHELSRSGAPSRRVQNQQHIRRWFDHWLQGKPAPEYHV